MEKGLPHSFRLARAEEELLAALVEKSGSKSESQYLRNLIHAQAALVLNHQPENAGQRMFEFVPRLESWGPLEQLVHAFAKAERVAGGDPPSWTKSILPSAAEGQEIAPPEVCCTNPLPIVAGAMFVCGNCKQQLPCVGAIALCKWRAAKFARTNLPLHEEVCRTLAALEQIRNVEEHDARARSARTTLARMYDVETLPESEMPLELTSGDHPTTEMVEKPEQESRNEILDAIENEPLEKAWPFADRYRATWDCIVALSTLQDRSSQALALKLNKVDKL